MYQAVIFDLDGTVLNTLEDLADAVNAALRTMDLPLESIDSVRENAAFYGSEFADELNRVIVHGLLHLIGYDDHTEEDIAQMRAKENYYLSQRGLI